MQFTQANAPQGDDLTLVWDSSKATDDSKIFLGTTVTGKYLETREVKTMNGMTRLYKLQVEGQDKLITVWGTKGLDDLFSRGNNGKAIPVGAIVKIDYKGKRQLEGGRSFHDFNVGFFIPAPEFKDANDEPFSDNATAGY